MESIMQCNENEVQCNSDCIPVFGDSKAIILCNVITTTTNLRQSNTFESEEVVAIYCMKLL